jgi:hypothetical protein
MNTKTDRSVTRWAVLSSAAAAIACVVAGLILLSRQQGTDQTAQAQTPKAAPKPAPPAGFHPRKVVGRFKPITEFPIVAVDKIGDRLNPSELVLGVTVGKQSRAYPINMLTGPTREILNDTLDGHPIAATW